MSKWLIGTYDCGSPKYKYFRRRKHRWKGKSIRYYMWIASCWKEETAFIKKYSNI